VRHALTNEHFKKLLVVFWACWWLIAFWTDLVGTLAHVGLLTASWAPDLNYPFLASSLKMYNAPEWLIQLFYVGIIAWSLLATVAFCWASASLGKSKTVWMHRMQIAFIISLSFWLAFFLADQIVMKFDLEENHMVQGGFQFLTFLAMYLLPDK
jgi:hypothetical protein